MKSSFYGRIKSVKKVGGVYEAVLELPINENTQAYTTLMSMRSEQLIITVSAKKPLRTLSSNSYFHHLVQKISQAMKVGFDEIKTSMVLQYGTPHTDEHGDLITVQVPKDTDIATVYPYAKWVGEEGKNAVYVLFKQTHTLNRAEMGRLIDGTVSEAQDLGIETLDPIKLRTILFEQEADDE